MKRYFIISLVVALIVGLLGVLQVQRSGDPSALIKEAEGKLSKAFEPKPIPVPGNLRGKFTNIRQITPAWSEIKETTEALTWQNQQIAEAKAMMHYDSYFDKMDSYVWQDRESLSNKPWFVEETSQFYLRKFYSGLTYAAIAFVATLLFIVLLSWSWKFLLARIREVSDAIRGK